MSGLDVDVTSAVCERQLGYALVEAADIEKRRLRLIPLCDWTDDMHRLQQRLYAFTTYVSSAYQAPPVKCIASVP